MTGAVVMTGAGPAVAHFCSKSFNAKAAEHAGASEAWLTADEYRAFLPFIEEECRGITAAIEPILADASGTRLFMGPGLLAGGTLKNGKGNTPDQVSYALLDAFIAHCPGE